MAVIPTPTLSVLSPGRIWGALDSRSNPSTGLTTVAMWRHGAVAMPPPLVWQSIDGSMRSSRGEPIPSTQLTVGDIDLSLFVDPASNTWGVFNAVNQPYVTTWVIPRRGEVRLLSGWSARMSVGLLPTGATAVSIVATKPGAGVSIDAMPDGSQWYLVAVPDKGGSDLNTAPLVKSISYTDGQGKRVTYKPKLIT